MTTLQLMVRHDGEGDHLSVELPTLAPEPHVRNHSRHLIGSQGLATLIMALRQYGYRPTSFKLMTGRYEVEPIDEDDSDYLALLDGLRNESLWHVLEDLDRTFPGLYFHSINLRALPDSGRSRGSITLAQEGVIQVTHPALAEDLRRDLQRIPASMVG